MAAKPKTIDDYLANLSADQRAALEKIRRTIKAAAPKAEECISYGLAAFRLDGKPLVAFGATASHCAFYPMSSHTVKAHQSELKKYDTSKGTIRFSAGKPLPAALVRKLVKARIEENDGRKPAKKAAKALTGDDINVVLADLKRLATKKTRDGMARYGLPADKALGVSVGDIQRLARRLGRSHELAAALWDTGCYEARMLAAYVDEPGRVTPAQMDRWCRDFDNWGICDTICFCLFDRTPHAWRKVEPWSRRQGEFAKRAGFVLMACLAGHDKGAADAQFVALLPLIDEGACDERNFVKKGVSWALRMIGRRNLKLHAAALPVARRLAESRDAACRWVGKDALRELTSPKVRGQLDRRAK